MHRPVCPTYGDEYEKSGRIDGVRNNQRVPCPDSCPSRSWEDNRWCAWRPCRWDHYRGGDGTSLLLRSGSSVCGTVLLLDLGRAGLGRLSLGSTARAGLRIALLRPGSEQWLRTLFVCQTARRVGTGLAKGRSLTQSSRLVKGLLSWSFILYDLLSL